MTTKYVMSGEVIDYVARGTITSGQVLVIGVRVGVALAAIADGSTGAVRVKGIFTLAKLSTDVVAAGDLLYWDADNTRITTTASTHITAGYAVADAGNGVATVDVNLNA